MEQGRGKNGDGICIPYPFPTRVCNTGFNCREVEFLKSRIPWGRDGETRNRWNIVSTILQQEVEATKKNVGTGTLCTSPHTHKLITGVQLWKLACLCIIVSCVGHSNHCSELDCWVIGRTRIGSDFDVYVRWVKMLVCFKLPLGCLVYLKSPQYVLYLESTPLYPWVISIQHCNCHWHLISSFNFWFIAYNTKHYLKENSSSLVYY